MPRGEETIRKALPRLFHMFGKHFSGFYPGDKHQKLKIEQGPGNWWILQALFCSSYSFTWSLVYFWNFYTYFPMWFLLLVSLSIQSHCFLSFRNSLKSISWWQSFSSTTFKKNLPNLSTNTFTQSPLYSRVLLSRHKYPADLHATDLL